MFSELHERLMRAKERARTAGRLREKLAHAQRAMHDESARNFVLKKRLGKEKQDVTTLEGLSLTGLFYTVLGTKDQQLEKERQELLAVRLKYDQGQDAVRSLQQTVSELEEELAEFDQAESEFETLVRRKEQLLIAVESQAAKELLALSESLADRNSDRTELEEAIQAGESALRSLEQVRTSLQSAISWGTWDLLGGDFFSTVAKHNRMNAARGHAHEAQRELSRFQNELADTGERLNVALEISGFSRFADLFFDGLITDWVVQSRIRQASQTCSETTSRVAAAVDACRQKLLQINAEVERLSQSRMALIESG